MPENKAKLAPRSAVTSVVAIHSPLPTLRIKVAKPGFDGEITVDGRPIDEVVGLPWDAIIDAGLDIIRALFGGGGGGGGGTGDGCTTTKTTFPDGSSVTVTTCPAPA